MGNRLARKKAKALKDAKDRAESGSRKSHSKGSGSHKKRHHHHSASSKDSDSKSKDHRKSHSHVTSSKGSRKTEKKKSASHHTWRKTPKGTSAHVGLNPSGKSLKSGKKTPGTKSDPTDTEGIPPSTTEVPDEDGKEPLDVNGNQPINQKNRKRHGESSTCENNSSVPCPEKIGRFRRCLLSCPSVPRNKYACAGYYGPPSCCNPCCEEPPTACVQVITQQCPQDCRFACNWSRELRPAGRIQQGCTRVTTKDQLSCMRGCEKTLVRAPWPTSEVKVRYCAMVR